MGEVKVWLGVDLGQCVDYTALAVVERVELQGEWDAAYYTWRKKRRLRLRHLERVPRKTPYRQVVDRVRQVVRDPAIVGDRQLVVDATGVGQAVVDMLDRAGLGCGMRKVQITGGDRERYVDGYYRVPKKDLVARVQVLLQEGDLEIAKGVALAEELVGEMMEMRVKTTAAGNEQFGVWREGEHDDLVLALAMACWGAGSVGDAGYCQRQGASCMGRCGFCEGPATRGMGGA